MIVGVMQKQGLRAVIARPHVTRIRASRPFLPAARRQFGCQGNKRHISHWRITVGRATRVFFGCPTACPTLFNSPIRHTALKCRACATG